jgi:N-sulfoglucosamine sulfohydrolase
MTRLELPRRDLLKAMGLGAAAAALPRELIAAAAPAKDAPRPNVLWLSAEDISPNLGCYGDTYATTPNLDRFAAQAVRYDRAFSHAPVCAPARSGIITGMYPTSIGTHQMRCSGVPPAEARCFPEYLRATGYYCTNNSKTDYQFAAPPSAWDESSRTAHWRNRPDKAMPFFAVLNFGVTHESSTRRWQPGRLQHDPAKAPVPPYYPDTPLVRQNIACYYDRISQLDAQVQKTLDQLAADGLAENTIVWFWGDHGMGLTRGKRWVYDSGLRVPLMVRVPEKLRRWAGAGQPGRVAPGRAEEELAAFVDFAPTMLSLAGIPIPKHMQGQAFLGPQKARPRRYVFGHRDRMDEAYDLIRCARDKRFKYIRNFLPQVTRGQHIDYMDRTPILQEMRRLHAAGKLAGARMQYFEPTKPVHELYDTAADPHEVRNLAADPKYRPVVERMDQTLIAWMKRIGDVGLIPEPDFDEMKRPGGRMQKTAEPAVTVRGGGEGKAVAVALSCPTPGASITCRVVGAAEARAGKGAVVLPARAAAIHGSGARKTGDMITHWRGRDTWISWEADIPRAGRLPVHVLQANAGAGGSRYRLTVGEARLEGVVKRTRSWTDPVYVKVGEVNVPKPGKYTVTVRPEKQVEGRLTNLGAVVLGGRNLRASKARWQLYSRPIELRPGETLTARANRLGFANSGTVSYRCGGPVPAPKAPPEKHPPHWREQIEKTDLLDRLLALKQLDGQGARAVPHYLKALADKAAPMRYWAVVGLHVACTDAASIDKAAAAIQPRLEDESLSVRVAAAHALGDWGRDARALGVLVETLASPSDKAALFAATALERLGPKARPAMAQIETAGRKTRRAAAQVLRRALAALRKEPA